MVKIIGIGVGKAPSNIHNSAETNRRDQCLVSKCWYKREVSFEIVNT